MHSNDSSSFSVASTLGIISALIVGFPLWAIFLALLNGNPIGVSGTREYLLAFAPIVGAAMPEAFSRLKHSPGSAFWLLATCPVLSAFNFFMAIAVSIRLGRSYTDIVCFVFTAVWAIPLVISLYNAAFRPEDTRVRHPSNNDSSAQ